MAYVSGVQAAIKRVQGIRKMHGEKRKLEIEIDSNGKEASEDPAFYGALHEREGSKYRYAHPALRNFPRRVLSDPAVKKYLKRSATAKGVKRSNESIDEATRIVADMAHSTILNYILSMPPKANGDPRLIETGALYDSIKVSLYNTKGRKIWEVK